MNAPVNRPLSAEVFGNLQHRLMMGQTAMHSPRTMIFAYVPTLADATAQAFDTGRPAPPHLISGSSCHIQITSLRTLLTGFFSATRQDARRSIGTRLDRSSSSKNVWRICSAGAVQFCALMRAHTSKESNRRSMNVKN